MTSVSSLRTTVTELGVWPVRRSLESAGRLGDLLAPWLIWIHPLVRPSGGFDRSRRQTKKPAWWNTLRYSTTPAYSSTSPANIVDPKNWTTRDVKLIEGHCCVPRFIMANTRQKRHPAAFKAKVALEAAKQTRTLAELSRAFQVHPVQISQWKKQLLDGVESLFGDGRRREQDESLAIQAELYEQIGRLNMEVEWLKKKVARCG